MYQRGDAVTPARQLKGVARSAGVEVAGQRTHPRSAVHVTDLHKSASIEKGVCRRL